MLDLLPSELPTSLYQPEIPKHISNKVKLTKISSIKLESVSTCMVSGSTTTRKTPTAETEDLRDVLVVCGLFTLAADRR